MIVQEKQNDDSLLKHQDNQRSSFVFPDRDTTMTIADDTDESVNDQAAVPSAYSMMDRIGGIDMKIKEKLNKKKEGLRKGKWTTEEEQYTNKVIETFNAGILELPENERGTTLRSYLSEKLGCDPMRITKKFTGASCLGKKVYHADNFKGFNRSEIDQATHELQVLELRFRSKLAEVNRKKTSSLSYYTEEQRVSTPAIDAFMKQRVSSLACDSIAGEKRKMELNDTSEVSNYLMQLNSQIMNMKDFEGTTASLSSTQSFNSSQSTLPSLRCDELLMAFKRSSVHQQQYLQAQEAFHADEYRKNILPILNRTSHVFRNPSTESSLVTQEATSLQLPHQQPQFHTNNNSGHDNYYQMSSHLNNANFAQSSSSSSVPFQYANNTFHNYPTIDNTENTDFNSSSSHSSSATDEDTDHNAAANSLIGFFNHIQRVGSQEDLVDYIAGVQRTVDACGRLVDNCYDNSKKSTVGRDNLPDNNSKELIRESRSSDDIPNYFDVNSSNYEHHSDGGIDNSNRLVRSESIDGDQSTNMVPRQKSQRIIQAGNES